MGEHKNKSRKFLYLAVSIANLVAFSSGIIIGWPSPVIAKLTDGNKTEENPFGEIISSEQESWMISIGVLGAACGPIMTGFLTNRLGRKKTLLCCSGVPLLVSFLLLTFGKIISLYYIARFIAGAAYGIVLSVLPNFLSEISEDAIRGMVCSSMNVFIMAGTLYSYVIGPYLSIMWFNASCAVWPALFLVLFFLIVPESPHYLIACNDVTGAMKSLKIFRSDSELSLMEKLRVIKYSVNNEMEKAGSFIVVFKSKGLSKALIITLTLIGFSIFSGFSVILFYAQSIFGLTESNIPPELSAIIIGIVQFCASFIAPLAVDRLGRKVLLLISAIGMLIAEVPLGLYFYWYETGKDVSNISWLPILCLIGCMIFYNCGFGMVPWTIMAEVFPANIKATASTLTSFLNAFILFLLTKSFPSLVDAIGMGGTFWLFSGFCALAVPFLLFYMIETKGKSFQEIQHILAK